MSSPLLHMASISRRSLSALLLLLPWLALGQDAGRIERVVDLQYGNALYHYFQNHELDALTELHLAQMRGGITGHGDNPELMKAGISLAYGMADVAEEIFIELLDQNHPETVRNAAWYYLARLHYLRGDWVLSEQAASKVTEKVEHHLAPSVQMIRTNLAIKTDRINDAELLLKDPRSYGEFLPYAYFNVATALSRTENHQAATPHYKNAVDAVYDLKPVTKDDLALIDKIRTAAGYNFLLAGSSTDAIGQFSQVQLTSIDSDTALLGYGRAAIEQSDYVSALKPWNELARRSLLSPAAKEALVSIPVAYERLGATGEALSAYEQAETTYVSEIERIEALLEFIEQGRFQATALLNEKQSRFETRAEAVSAPRAQQLAELFSLNQFQERAHEFQDLRELRSMIDLWTQRLDLYSDMLDERQLLRLRDQEALDTMHLESQIRELEQKSKRLQEKNSDIENQKDYLALTTGDTVNLKTRIEDSKSRIEKLRQSGEDTSSFEEPLEFYSGLMLWQAAEDFAVNIYDQKRTAMEVEDNLESLKKTHDRVTQIFASAPDIAPYKHRINELRSRLDSGSIAIDQLIEAAEQSLVDEIRDELNGQKKRLRVYLSQAKLSIARIYDADHQGAAAP